MTTEIINLSDSTLNVFIAKKVFDSQFPSGIRVWDGAHPLTVPYASDGNAMIALLRQMEIKGFHYEIVTGGRTRFSYPGHRKSWRSVGAATLPRAVAETALEAVETVIAWKAEKNAR